MRILARFLIEPRETPQYESTNSTPSPVSRRIAAMSMSQRDLAAKVGVTRPYIAQLEAGERGTDYWTFSSAALGPSACFDGVAKVKNSPRTTRDDARRASQLLGASDPKRLHPTVSAAVDRMAGFVEKGKQAIGGGETR